MFSRFIKADLTGIIYNGIIIFMEEQNQISKSPPLNRVRSRQIIKSFEAKLAGKKKTSEKFADYVTSNFGSIGFFLFNIAWFAIWITWNLGLISGLPIFDPYPFILLITIVSLEAIILSVMVLISQNRTAKIDRLRAEVTLQVDLISEQEITKILSLLLLLLEKHGVDVNSDPEVQKMLKKVDPWYIEKKIEEQLR